MTNARTKRPTRQDRRWRHCLRKVTYRTEDLAQDEVNRRQAQVIYFHLTPQAYPCQFGSHYHVGHSLSQG